MATIDPIKEFRKEHRQVRDDLLDMIEALESKNVVKAKKILARLNIFVGPHLRFEEESFYPVLRVFLGEHVNRLIKEHDGIIDIARSYVELLHKNILTDEDALQAADDARTLLIHVANCDGLAILAEKLDQRELEHLGEKFGIARELGIPLLKWAEKIRN